MHKKRNMKKSVATAAIVEESTVGVSETTQATTVTAESVSKSRKQ